MSSNSSSQNAAQCSTLRVSDVPRFTPQEKLEVILRLVKFIRRTGALSLADVYSVFSRRSGISTSTLRRWHWRYLQRGPRGLEHGRRRDARVSRVFRGRFLAMVLIGQMYQEGKSIQAVWRELAGLWPALYSGACPSNNSVRRYIRAVFPPRPNARSAKRAGDAQP